MYIATELSTFDDPTGRRELLTIAGFLAGYGTATRNSYATDLRIYADWCAEFGLRLFEVQRSHLELFGRSMEARGLMASTVARAATRLISATATDALAFAIVTPSQRPSPPTPPVIASDLPSSNFLCMTPLLVGDDCKA